MAEQWILTLSVAILGGIGAVARFVVDGFVTARLARKLRGSPLPLGIVAVNLSGSLLIGVLSGVVSAASPYALLFGAGLLGGYTTFSTASADTVRLIRGGRPVAALVHGLGQMLLALMCAVLGFWIAQLFLGK